MSVCMCIYIYIYIDRIAVYDITLWPRVLALGRPGGGEDGCGEDRAKYMYVCICIYIYICIHIYIYIYVYIYIMSCLPQGWRCWSSAPRPSWASSRRPCETFGFCRCSFLSLLVVVYFLFCFSFFFLLNLDIHFSVFPFLCFNFQRWNTHPQYDSVFVFIYRFCIYLYISMFLF